MIRIREAIKKFSAWLSSVQNKILLIVARLRTWRAQYDFWAINILCILVYEHSVCQMVSRMLTPVQNCTQVSEKLLKRYRRDPATSILSQNNKACNGTNESVKIIIFITLHNSVFFMSKFECKLPTTAKMHKIFIAQKSYCTWHVLSLAIIRSR